MVRGILDISYGLEATERIGQSGVIIQKVGDFGGGICASGRALNAATPGNIILDCVSKYRPVTGLEDTIMGKFGVYGGFLGGHNS